MLLLVGSLLSAQQQTPPLTPDMPAKFAAPTDAYDYVKRDVMIPMRDGVKLHTVIVLPKGARRAPILLTRTPYNASSRAQRNASPHMVAALPLFDELFAADGYIRVYQDVRGKYGSEGEYVMTRPLRGPLNDSKVDRSTDVLTYMTPPLTETVRLRGTPVVHLVASTSGTDSDWVVKLIDDYPDEVPSQPELGGYQLGIAMDISRGRYRASFERPQAIAPNKALPYTFALPTVNHIVKLGHRIMVQVQSSWFPLYDRNPQTFVPNIFFAKPNEYVKATQRVYHAAGEASYIDLPVVTR